MANAIIPAAEVAATNQVTAPAATILTAPATEQKEPQTNSTSRRRRSTTPPMWRVMTQARPVFDVQLKKDNEIKLACINKFMNAAYSDANKFWADFMEQVNILLDSRRYCRECEILGLKPEYVAEHIGDKSECGPVDQIAQRAGNDQGEGDAAKGMGDKSAEQQGGEGHSHRGRENGQHPSVLREQGEGHSGVLIVGQIHDSRQK